MSMRAPFAGLLALVLLAGAAGAPGRTPVGTTASGGSILSNAPHAAVVDSGPSADAAAVLSSIPEPLAPGERVPPGASGAIGTRAGARADSAAGTTAGGAAPTGADSTGAARAESRSASADTGDAVPVPEPTAPLGDAPGSLARHAALDSAMRAMPAAPPSATTAHPRPDSCWRVQIAAPLVAAEAELKRSAAESLLLQSMVIVHEKGRYKVRTRDCLTRAAAVALRQRAVGSSFTGAFTVVEVKR
jgi:hypothetical protein